MNPDKEESVHKYWGRCRIIYAHKSVGRVVFKDKENGEGASRTKTEDRPSMGKVGRSYRWTSGVEKYSLFSEGRFRYSEQ